MAELLSTVETEATWLGGAESSARAVDVDSIGESN
jgi:hypothetical protein